MHPDTIERQPGTLMSRLLGKALGSVVSPIVEYVDVNGVVNRVDVDELVQRIDINALLDKVDIARLLNRIDINEQVERLDLNAIVNRIDFDVIIEKSNLEAIIARSSSSVISSVWDRVRTLFVSIDQSFQPLGSCSCCKTATLPPRPGDVRPRKNRRPYPTSSSQLAIEIQGSYAGVAVRLAAWLLDAFIIWLAFTITWLLVEVLISFITQDEPQWLADGKDWEYIPICFALMSYLYRAGLTFVMGGTIGKICFGLLVVDTNGTRVRALKAFWRELLVPFSALSIVGILIGWVRRDGRTAHDLGSCTGVVYSWDARMAQVRQRSRPDDMVARSV